MCYVTQWKVKASLFTRATSGNQSLVWGIVLYICFADPGLVHLESVVFGEEFYILHFTAWQRKVNYGHFYYYYLRCLDCAVHCYFTFQTNRPIWVGHILRQWCYIPKSWPLETIERFSFFLHCFTGGHNCKAVSPAWTEPATTSMIYNLRMSTGHYLSVYHFYIPSFLYPSLLPILVTYIQLLLLTRC